MDPGRQGTQDRPQHRAFPSIRGARDQQVSPQQAQRVRLPVLTEPQEQGIQPRRTLHIHARIQSPDHPSQRVNGVEDDPDPAR